MTEEDLPLPEDTEDPTKVTVTSTAKAPIEDEEGQDEIPEAIVSSPDEAPPIILTAPTAVVCSICLEQLQVGDVAFAPQCEHLFHMNCVEGWMKSLDSSGCISMKCPNCRLEVLTAEQLKAAFMA
jgi:hypothetical protein